MKVGSVVQFNENHKWCGCLGIITESKEINTANGVDFRYMIGVPVPMEGTAYIFSMHSKNEIDYIGQAALMVAK